MFLTVRKQILSIGCAALVIVSTLPASAGPMPRAGLSMPSASVPLTDVRYRRHRGGGNGAAIGALLFGAAAVGIVAAIASQERRDREEERRARYYRPYPVYGHQDGYYEEPVQYAPVQQYYAPPQPQYHHPHWGGGVGWHHDHHGRGFHVGARPEGNR